MNLMEKICGSGEENEHPPTIDRLFSSSTCAAPYHHHHRHHQQHPPFLPPPSYNHHHHDGLSNWPLALNHHDEEEAAAGGCMMVEREHMFDKVVTPSDVGKLNRLVIPKQHAERYFPLDTSTNDKGLLLNFEDRNGKLWRFRYSYWNSSQSYVMTKGWSRFVKEKKLDAGDIVSFQRGVGVTAKDRLFIDWRRRVNPSSPPSSNLSFPFYNHSNFIHPWKPLVLQSLPARKNPNLMLQPNSSSSNPSSRSVYFGAGGGFGAPLQQVERMQRGEFQLGFDPPSKLHGKAASGKRLRLFGVNMDCVFSEDEDDQGFFLPGEFTNNTVVAGCSTVNPLIPSSSSSSFSTIPYLQLRPACGEGAESSTILSSSSGDHDFNIIAKPTASNMSLDLKM